MNNIPYLLPVTLLPLLHYLLVGRRRGMVSLDGIFVIMQWVMASGTVALLDLTDERDRSYLWITVVPYAVYVLTSIVVNSRPPATEFHRTVGIRPVSPVRFPSLLALYALSLLITIAYFQAVGYNVLLMGVQSLAGGGTPGADYGTLRLNSYAESRYLYPGYVNQFKNILLPALTVVFVHNLLSRGRTPGRLALSAVLALIAAVALLGTGQRGAFVLFVLVVLAFVYHVSPRRFPSRFLGLMLLAAPPMLVTTVLLGRSSTALAGATGATGKLSVTVTELLGRFFHDNQWSGQMAYHYLYGKPTVWGSEWLAGVLGILPSSPGSSLAREVFRYLYGTDRGTAPPSSWGSVYYNFSWYGLLVVPFVLALLARATVNGTHRRPERNALEMVGALGFAVVAGSWVAGGPDYFTNAGGLAIVALWWWGHRVALAEARQAQEQQRREEMLRRREQARLDRARRAAAARGPRPHAAAVKP